MKSPTERGPIGAWAYETRDRLGLSVEQVVERLPTRYHPATLRKVEGGSAQAGRRMLRELADFYLSEGERRSVAVLAPPGQKEPATPEGMAGVGALVQAMRDQTDALVTAIQAKDEALARRDQQVAELLAQNGRLLIELGRYRQDAVQSRTYELAQIEALRQELDTALDAIRSGDPAPPPPEAAPRESRGRSVVQR